MLNVFTVTEDCEYDLLNLIEKYLKNLPANDKPKIYFSGEFDSNQSSFEHSSNNIELGVLAYNKQVALVLLRFLRIIIDNRQELLMEDSFGSVVEEFDHKMGCVIEIFTMNEKMKINEIIRNISEKEEPYMHSFLLDKPISTSFVKHKHNFTKRLDEIDIWTLPRIMKEMKELY